MLQTAAIAVGVPFSRAAPMHLSNGAAFHTSPIDHTVKRLKGKFTMSTLSIVILLAVAGVIAGAIFSPKFRQLLRIRGGKAVDAGTTALEKEQDQYKVLVAKIPAQRDSVARTKAGAVIAQKKLGTLTEKLASIEAEYKQADTAKAPADVVAAIEADYTETEAAIEAQKKIASEAAAVAASASFAFLAICSACSLAFSLIRCRVLYSAALTVANVRACVLAHPATKCVRASHL